MEDQNYEQTLRLADTSISEMFPRQNETVATPENNTTGNSMVAKIKEKHAHKKKLEEHKQKVLDRYTASGTIHNEKHSVAIPRMGMKPGVLYLNPMIAFVVEGTLEENLMKIQGRF